VFDQIGIGQKILFFNYFILTLVTFEIFANRGS